MAEPIYLLDTNIVIALMNVNQDVAARLRQCEPGSVVITTVVLQELVYGAYKSQRVAFNLGKIAKLRFPVLAFDEEDAHIAGQIQAHLARAGTLIGPNDVQIAAQALARDLTLVTHNRREFARVPDLRVEDWLA